MKYHVSVAGSSFEIEVRGGEVLVDGRPREARLVRVPGSAVRQLVVGTRARTYLLDPGEEGWVVQWGGDHVVADVVDERTRALRAVGGAEGGTRGGGVVRAPMPGLVLRVDVEVGARVEGGAGLLVLEAMKMENEITAPGPGVITAIHAVPGRPVEKGVVLVEMVPAEA